MFEPRSAEERQRSELWRTGLETGARRIGLFVLRLWPYFLAVGIWQASVTIGDLHRLVVPPPGDVASDIVSAPGIYFSYIWPTLVSAALGLLIGTAVGMIIALAVWLSWLLSGLLTTTMIMLYSAPIVATIPLMARVMGYSRITVISVAALVSMFPTFVLVRSGMRAVPPGSEDVFDAFGARQRMRLFRLAIPASMPNFLTAFRLNSAVSFIAAVIGEYLTGVDGLGWLFLLSFSRYDVTRAWGAAIVIIALSVVAYVGAAIVEERCVTRWN